MLLLPAMWRPRRMIQTSYFGRAKNLENAVAISQGVPRWFTGPRYPALAPSWALVKEQNEKIYSRRYNSEVLAKLDPCQVKKDLEGKILLCHEKPGEFCHRRLVAEWLANTFCIEVPELGYQEPAIKPRRVACDLSMFAVI